MHDKYFIIKPFVVEYISLNKSLFKIQNNIDF